MRKWWHKIRGFESFRIARKGYPTSRKMDWKEAMAFAAVYGGEIIFDPDEDMFQTTPL